jgi:hypothetical protein
MGLADAQAVSAESSISRIRKSLAEISENITKIEDRASLIIIPAPPATAANCTAIPGSETAFDELANQISDVNKRLFDLARRIKT